MVNADSSLWITFNGEIYNYRELAAELMSAGHTFRTRTDTEVLLAAYAEYGIDCVKKLRGMFAFAIWDARRRTLFIARDRVGKKPLHYFVDRDGISFASEPKAFLADPAFCAEPDLDALSDYLSYQYVPSPQSAFKGVRKLAPAHYLLVRDGVLSTERYWKLSYAKNRRISEADAREELLARLREAVRLRLISDVPLGAFLSGGIDSSAVVALMAQCSSNRVKTFSIGFKEQDYNELPFARAVAHKYGTDHHEFVVSPRATEIFPKLVWHYNEPYADESAIPTFYLAQLARQHVTVALNGDGGDENFAGYKRYLESLPADCYGRLPDGARRFIARTLNVVSPPDGPGVFARGRRWVARMAAAKTQRYAHRVMQFDCALKKEICTPEFLQATARRDSADLVLKTFGQSDAGTFVDAALDVDVAHYLPDCLLVKVDIATMAHGLEGRSPLLDHSFMEFAASLPSTMKLRGSSHKYIFKQAVQHLLPPEILNRPKIGFGVPLDQWFRHELRELAYDLLLSRRMRERGYFRAEVVERLLREHANGTRAWQDQLWNLLMLEMWHRTFIDPPAIGWRDGTASLATA
jgi:asparagine synthase (glutamine-hydrolysing)